MTPANDICLPSNPALTPRAGRLGLEEAWGEGVTGRAGAAAFCLVRAAEDDARPVLLAAPRVWLREQGLWLRDGLKALGLEDSRLLFVQADRDAQVLWALEEGLKSQVIPGGVAAPPPTEPDPIGDILTGLGVTGDAPSPQPQAPTPAPEPGPAPEEVPY